MAKTFDFLTINFILYHEAVLKPYHYMTHYFEFSKHHLVMQPLQNSPLCSIIFLFK